MNKPEHDSLTLAQEPADDKVVKQLYSHGFINAQGRIYALQWLNPHQRWGYWISLLCTLIGCTLVLAGMIFFFAHNWQKMSIFYKFCVIEAALVCALFGAWTYSLQTVGGKLCLSSASVLVGIFLAVFGQIYQTGADAYQLFMTWSLLIIPWVLISCFAPLWMIGLVLLNLSCVLYWAQTIAPSSFDSLLLVVLMLLNTIFLILRERFNQKNIAWLQSQWQRIILLSMLLVMSFIPLEMLILNHSWDKALLMSATLGALIQGGLFAFYCYYHLDRWAFTLILLNFCILLLSLLWQFSQNFNGEALQLLFMAISTLVVFTLGATVLKKMTYLSRPSSRNFHENH